MRIEAQGLSCCRGKGEYTAGITDFFQLLLLPAFDKVQLLSLGFTSGCIKFACCPYMEMNSTFHCVGHVFSVEGYRHVVLWQSPRSFSLCGGRICRDDNQGGVVQRALVAKSALLQEMKQPFLL